MGPVTGLGMALLFPALLFCGFQLVATFLLLLLFSEFIFCVPDLDSSSPLPQ